MLLTRLIDFAYPPFKKWMPLQVYHYLACGTINTLSDWLLYFLIYNFVVCKQVVDWGWIAFTPHIASLLIVTPITLTIGFCLSKYITFAGSTLRTQRQAVRYTGIIAVNFVLSYLGLKLFCEVLGLWATPSKMLVTVITTICSFLLQKYFSFKTK